MKKNEMKQNFVSAELLQTKMELHDCVSLRKLANTLDISYPAVLKASKTPVRGEMYDPDKVNWCEVAKVLNRLSTEEGWDMLDWNAMNTAVTRKQGFLDHDPNNFKVGDNVYLRKHPTTPYTIVYKTDTHIVFMLEGSTEPLCWKISTFMLNGPVHQPRVQKAEVELEVAGEE